MILQIILQDVAIFGKQSEAIMDIKYSDMPVTYPDGYVVVLGKPAYEWFKSLSIYACFVHDFTKDGATCFWFGLLENIPESTVLSFAVIRL